MSLTYTDNGASETQAYRSVHPEYSGPTQFERLGNLSTAGSGPPPAGVSFEWVSYVNASLDCTGSGQCLQAAAGHGCTGVYQDQCTWPDDATARKYCAAWSACAGFFCSSVEVPGQRVCFARGVSGLTAPHGAGDVTWLRAWNRTAAVPVWRQVEAGPVRTVFSTQPVQTMHSAVWIELVVWANMSHLDLRVHIDGWNDAFGVANRIVLPIAGDGE